jgi:hypothetical protein
MKRQIDAGGMASPTFAEVSFKVTNHEAETIDAIADRALRMAQAHRSKRAAGSKLDWTMDITATHANGCPMKLHALLEADDFNFAHDVFGIERHLNRSTGQLEHCFLPRYADVALMKEDRW